MTENNNPVIRENINLKRYHTFGVPVTARYFTEIQTEGHLKHLITENFWKEKNWYLLGGGSNILFLNDFEGLVIKNSITNIDTFEESEQDVLIEVGAGENWHQLVMACVDNGWGGIENLALIPGTVGAAPIQNIGAYGVELEEVFHSLDAVCLETGTHRRFLKEDCHFGYRTSIFKKELKSRYAITRVRLKLTKNGKVNTSYSSLKQQLDRNNIKNPGINDVAEAVIQIRSKKLPDPDDIGNAGSFFKNPVVNLEQFKKLEQDYPSIKGYRLDDNRVKIPAAWLIDQAGWKGRAIGEVATHHKQALVIVNKGGATADEIYDYAQKIKNDVHTKYDILLEEEVNIIR